MRQTRAILVGALTAIAVTASAGLASDGTTDSLAAWKAEPGRIFDSSEVALDAFLWEARPIVIFADTPQDPAFRRQIELFEARIDELIRRDVVLITDTSRSDPSDLRKKLRPRGFMLTIIGKDGAVKLRKPFPWDVREVSRSIDKMPLRQQEIRESVDN